MPQNVLATLKSSLAKAIGENLISIVHYSPGLDAVGIRVLIVVKDFDNDTWDKLGEAFGRIKGSDQLSPMLVTTEELKSSTDVFPLTFFEMKRQYQVVYGEDLLKNLDIRHTHLRLRCEQELKNSLFRMQTTFLKHTHSRQHLQAAIQRHFGSFKRALIGCSILYGQRPPDDDAELLSNAATNLGLHLETLKKGMSVAESANQQDIQWLRAIYIELMSQIQSAAQAVDQMADETQIIELLDPGV